MTIQVGCDPEAGAEASPCQAASWLEGAAARIAAATNERSDYRYPPVHLETWTLDGSAPGAYYAYLRGTPFCFELDLRTVEDFRACLAETTRNRDAARLVAQQAEQELVRLNLTLDVSSLSAHDRTSLADSTRYLTATLDRVHRLDDEVGWMERSLARAEAAGVAQSGVAAQAHTQEPPADFVTAALTAANEFLLRLAGVGTANAAEPRTPR